MSDVWTVVVSALVKLDRHLTGMSDGAIVVFFVFGAMFAAFVWYRLAVLESDIRNAWHRWSQRHERR